MPEGEPTAIEGLTPLTGNGEDGRLDNGDSTAHAWQVLLDAQIRLEASATSIRQNLMLTAAVLVLATLILERFLFLTQPEVVLIGLLPAVLLAAGAAIDLAWYDRRVRSLGETIRRLEVAHPEAERLADARDDARGRTFSRAGLIAYYAIPLVLVLAVAAWRFL